MLRRTHPSCSQEPPEAGGGTAALDPDALFAPLRDAKGLLLAVSGGPDSTALLLLIDRWRRATGMPIAAATVDHRLRQGSSDEASAVAALCEARGIVHRSLVWSEAAGGPRLQERAREARYALLVECAAGFGADTIVTGHHADDQAETILMRLTRGSGPAGLAGMRARTRRGAVTIARPLLDVPKAALVAVCRAEGVACADDPSNRDQTFRRTALRRLAPRLAAEGLDREALLRLGRRAARAEDALQWAERQALAALLPASAGGVISLPASTLVAWPEEVVLRILMRGLATLVPHTRVRLDRLENLVARLSESLAADRPFSATLAGCTLRLRAGVATLAEAPPRKSLAERRKHVSAAKERYPSSLARLGNLSGDA